MGLEVAIHLSESANAQWAAGEHGWLARPDAVMAALAGQGFEEFKREVARGARGCPPAGGVWQGLHRATGAVASAVWVRRGDDARALVYLEIDGRPLEG
jgi:hypothetical protein